MCSSRYAFASIAFRNFCDSCMRDSSTPFSRSASTSCHAGLVGEVLDFGDLEAAAAADEPSRLRPNRAPSSSAQSTTLIVTGGCWPLNIRSASRPAITPSAPSSQPPFGHRIEVAADDDGAIGRAFERRPAVAGGIDLRRDAELGELAVEPLPRLPPHRPPRQPLRAIGVRREFRELAEIRDDVLCAHRAPVYFVHGFHGLHGLRSTLPARCQCEEPRRRASPGAGNASKRESKESTHRLFRSRFRRIARPEGPAAAPAASV